MSGYGFEIVAQMEDEDRRGRVASKGEFPLTLILRPLYKERRDLQSSDKKNSQVEACFEPVSI